MDEAATGSARKRLRLADGVALAASPTFLTMALLTGVTVGPAELLCGPTPSSPFGGMVAMYLLMSLFHAAPWLRLIRARG